MTQTEPHRVIVEEVEGADQPLPKAEGNVLGFQTQRADLQSFADLIPGRIAKAEQWLADEKALQQRVQGELNALNAAVDEAEAALPAAREAQAEYDALPQAEKDRLAAERSLVRARAEAVNAQAALAQAEADAAAAAEAAAAAQEG